MTHPKLVVFDLDFTLWDCGGTWCDCLAPPFHGKNHRVYDRQGKHVRCYSDVSTILDFCDENHIIMSLASRTNEPSWARELLRLLDLSHRFTHAEIYPASKLKHFASLQTATGMEYQEMLFFDDEMRNIREVSTLGVTSIMVEEGLSHRLFEQGLQQFASRRT